MIDRSFPMLGVEVRDADLMALGSEFLDSDVAQRAIERARFRMGEDEQNFDGTDPAGEELPSRYKIIDSSVI